MEEGKGRERTGRKWDDFWWNRGKGYGMKEEEMKEERGT